MKLKVSLDRPWLGIAALAIGLLAAATTMQVAQGETLVEYSDADFYASTYLASPAPVTAITNATALTGTGERIPNATILMVDGKIKAVGTAVDVPDGAVVIDAEGKWVTPGIIDAHSHLGVYALPNHASTSNGNEITGPVKPGVWAEHSVNPQDAAFSRALAGGVTTVQILPGSANLFGGRTVVLKVVPRVTVREMKFPGAAQGLKMACGENPKRNYKETGPSTSMANAAGYRKAFAEASEYRDDWERYGIAITNGESIKPPKRDLDLDTLAAVLDGNIVVNIHCYRADEMALMLTIANEFGFKVSTFHHAVEAYKIAPLLVENKVCVATWADWWGYKLEAFDTVEANASIIHAEGGCAIIKSDDAVEIQYLNQMVSKAWTAGRQAGIEIPQEEAIAWITLNPASALGIANQTGSLEPGKNADVVLWSANPFSVYALAEKVYVDGSLEFDRSALDDSWQVDLETWYSEKGAHQ